MAQRLLPSGIRYDFCAFNQLASAQLHSGCCGVTQVAVTCLSLLCLPLHRVQARIAARPSACALLLGWLLAFSGQLHVVLEPKMWQLSAPVCGQGPAARHGVNLQQIWRTGQVDAALCYTPEQQSPSGHHALPQRRQQSCPLPGLLHDPQCRLLFLGHLTPLAFN